MSETSDFLTVATVDYTPQAVATLRSAKRHSLHMAYYFFALDGTREAVENLRRILAQDDPWICVFGPNDLGPEREIFLSAFKYYNAIEISCLAKYVGIAHVLRNAGASDICVYADCDILFLGDVVSPIREFKKNVVLLTPHQFGPSSDDIEQEYLLHGWINAGFLCFRRDQPRTFEVIDWLVHRISRRGYLVPQFGLFCDQTWVSSLPFAFHGHVDMSQHPGLNVAYWNLDERHLASNGDVVLVNGLPLLFFHFSGFDSKNLTRLSKHSDVLVLPGSVLEKVCQLYRSELEGTAPLHKLVATLTALPCSKALLQERIYLGSVHNRLSVSSPVAKLGFFSKIGRKLDFLLRRVMA